MVTTLKLCMSVLYQLHIQNTSSGRSNREFCLRVSNNLLSISSKTRGDRWWFRAQKQIPTPHLKNSSQLNKLTFHILAVRAAHSSFYHSVFHSTEDHTVHYSLQMKKPEMTEIEYLLGSCTGISPTKELFERYKDSNCVKFPIEEGISPERAFFEMLRTWIALNFISTSGIGPSKWLDEKSMDVNIVRILTNFISWPVL